MREKIIKEMLEMAEILKQADMSNNNTGHNTDYKQFNYEDVIRYGCGRLNGVSMLYNAGYRKAREVVAEGFKNMAVKQAKQELARVMIDEFENCMRDFEDDDGYLLKKCEFEFFMRELKKEYMGE